MVDFLMDAIDNEWGEPEQQLTLRRRIDRRLGEQVENLFASIEVTLARVSRHISKGRSGL